MNVTQYVSEQPAQGLNVHFHTLALDGLDQVLGSPTAPAHPRTYCAN